MFQDQVQIRPLRDWNLICSILKLWYNFVQIRPLRDWNDYMGTHRHEPIKFKSDRCGIETSGQISCQYPDCCSNQTVAGLKHYISTYHGKHCRKFKSDRCGIETIFSKKHENAAMRFKSDRCGIETNGGNPTNCRVKSVQIRPLRDWNLSM